MKLLEALRGLIDGFFEPLNALFRTRSGAPLSLDDPAAALEKSTVLNMVSVEAARTSEPVTRGVTLLTRAPDEAGKLEDQARIQSEIERGL